MERQGLDDLVDGVPASRTYWLVEVAQPNLAEEIDDPTTYFISYKNQHLRKALMVRDSQRLIDDSMYSMPRQLRAKPKAARG